MWAEKQRQCGLQVSVWGRAELHRVDLWAGKRHRFDLEANGRGPAGGGLGEEGGGGAERGEGGRGRVAARRSGRGRRSGCVFFFEEILPHVCWRLPILSRIHYARCKSGNASYILLHIVEVRLKKEAEGEAARPRRLVGREGHPMGNVGAWNDGWKDGVKA
jgi:hypothetical protein